MTELPKKPRAKRWLFPFVFMFAGAFGSLFGGPAAWINGAVLGLFLALPFPTIRRLENNGRKPVTAVGSILIGTAFGLAGGIVSLSLYAIYRRFDEFGLMPMGAGRALWLPVLYGFCVRAVIVLGERNRFNEVDFRGAIYLAMSVCSFFKFWPGYDVEIGFSAMAAFGNMYLYALSWTGAAVFLEPEIFRKERVFKGRTRDEIVRTAIAAGLSLLAIPGAVFLVTAVTDGYK